MILFFRKRFKPGSKDRIRKPRVRSENDSICEELNTSAVNASEIDATPLCSLPGNNSRSAENHREETQDVDEAIHTSGRKSGSAMWKHKPVSNDPEVEENIDFSVSNNKCLI